MGMNGGNKGGNRSFLLSVVDFLPLLAVAEHWRGCRKRISECLRSGATSFPESRRTRRRTGHPAHRRDHGIGFPLWAGFWASRKLRKHWCNNGARRMSESPSNPWRLDRVFLPCCLQFFSGLCSCALPPKGDLSRRGEPRERAPCVHWPPQAATCASSQPPESWKLVPAVLKQSRILFRRLLRCSAVD